MTRPIAYAVWLGANTARRLAREWRISLSRARARLRYAEKKGIVVGKRRSCGAIKYRVARVGEGMGEPNA